MTLLAGSQNAPGDTTGPLRSGGVADEDMKLERKWEAAPSLEVLLQAATSGKAMPLPRQMEWSKRLRAAGLWHHCPLVATAQDGSSSLGRRALAAAAAWTIDRDRQGRAVLRCLMPALGHDDLRAVHEMMGPDAATALAEGPFVWSITPFFNELDMLKARLCEMARVVDRFVVIEAGQTFRGDAKSLFYQDNRALFSRWSTQLDHVIVDLPDGPDAWARERYQRNIAKEVLTDLEATKDDVVLLTDLDEIVRAGRVAAITAATASSPVILAMPQYWYSFDWKEDRLWGHPKAFRFGQVPEASTYHDVRHTQYPVVANAGWHLSWFGDEERFDTKLRSFSHSEFDTPERRQHTYQHGLINGGVDIHGRRLTPAVDCFPASLSVLFEQGGQP